MHDLFTKEAMTKWKLLAILVVAYIIYRYGGERDSSTNVSTDLSVQQKFLKKNQFLKNVWNISSMQIFIIILIKEGKQAELGVPHSRIQV